VKCIVKYQPRHQAGGLPVKFIKSTLTLLKIQQVFAIFIVLKQGDIRVKFE